MSDTAETPKPKKKATQWHQLFAWMLRELLTEVGVEVQSELPLGDKPPQVDIVLLRLSDATQWTTAQRERLPDGIRQSAANHLLIEFKFSESFGRKAVLQALVYDSLYRWLHPNLAGWRIQTFIVVSQTPRAQRRARFGYTQSTQAGVYESDNLLLQQIPLIVLNQLSDEAHNAFFKLFGSQQKSKQAAANQLRQRWWQRLSAGLLRGLRQLLELWMMKGDRIMGELTVEDIKRADPQDVEMILAMMLLDEETRKRFEQLPQVEAIRQQGQKQGLEQGQKQGLEQGQKQGLEQGQKQGLEQGQKQGLEQGRKQTLLQRVIRTLTIRFDQPLPSDWEGYLAEKSLDELEHLNDVALLVNNLAEFATHVPQLPTNHEK